MDFSILFGAPMVMFGILAALLVVGVLAFFKNRWRIVLALAGGAIGYFALGTRLAHEFTEEAIRQHRCPDAGWVGPAAGLLRGAMVAVIAFEIARFARRTFVKPRPAGAGEQAAP